MLAIKDLSFKIGSFFLQDINLNIEKNEYFILLGRSGSGKTTLIKCISGLNKPLHGNVLLHCKDISNLEPEYRNIGYLPQNFALFPHLNVENNILFGLRTRKPAKAEVKERLDKITHLLGIGSLLGRDVNNLSGGEKQKAALARALIVYPDVLLLDEPFSSIDHGLRVELWFEVKAILKKLNIIVIHITHNLEEAYALADNMAVLIDGRIEQHGTKEDIFLKPRSEQVALYQGIKNIYSGNVVEVGREKITIEEGSFKIIALKEREFKVGQKIKFCIRPQDIKIIKPDLPVIDDLKDNLFEGEIGPYFFYNEVCIIKLKSIVDFELRFPVYIYQRYNFYPGKKIQIGIWQKGISIFDDEK